MNKLPKYQQIAVLVGITFVGILTGTLSWFHGNAHATYLGETAIAAILIPFVPDVSMLISIFLRRVEPGNGWAKAGMWAGIAVTIWMNVSNVHVFPGDLQRTIQSAVLSLVPPAFLFICIEMAFSIGHTAEVAEAAKAEVDAKKAEKAEAKTEAELLKEKRAEIAKAGWATRRALQEAAKAEASA